MPLWPQALGGALAPALFQSTAFCGACGNLCRDSIDGVILKSWFMQAELARASLAFLDPATPAPAPLTYLGVAHDFPVGEGETCDRWSGLAGEQIYHIHREDDSIWSGHGGMAPAAPEPAPQRAIIVLASSSHYWAHLAVLSLAAHFPQAERYCLHEYDDELTRGLPVMPFSRMVNSAQANYVRDKGNRSKVLNRGLASDGAPRFLIKMALGLGANLFGADWLDSAACRQLRRSFWEPQPRARRTTFPRDAAARPVMAGDAAEARGSLHWPGAWTICLGLIDDCLGLILVTPNGRMLDIAVSDGPPLWEPAFFARWREPMVHIAIPQRGYFSAPMQMSAFMAHRDGERRDPELARLESLAIAPGMLPNKQGFA